MNHTSLPLVFRQPNRSQTAAGQSDLAVELARPLLSMFACDGEALSGGNKCSVKINKSNWSKEVALDSVGGSGSIDVQDYDDNGNLRRVYDLGVSIANAPGRFRCSKVVTFVPRYVIVNATAVSLQLTQQLSSSSTSAFQSGQHAGASVVQEIKPGEKLSFHWPQPGSARRLCVRSTGNGWRWSGPFSLHEIGDFHIKLGTNIQQPMAPQILLRVEIRLCGARYSLLSSPYGSLNSYRAF